MIAAVEDKKVLTVVDRYFTKLEETGYVYEAANKNLLVYLFLADFAKTEASFLSDMDNDIIESILIKLFAGGCCLMPYSDIYQYKEQMN